MDYFQHGPALVRIAARNVVLQDAHRRRLPGARVAQARELTRRHARRGPNEGIVRIGEDSNRDSQSVDAVSRPRRGGSQLGVAFGYDVAGWARGRPHGSQRLADARNYRELFESLKPAWADGDGHHSVTLGSIDDRRTCVFDRRARARNGSRDSYVHEQLLSSRCT